MTAVRTTAQEDVRRFLVDAVQGQGFGVLLEKPAECDDWMALAPQRGAWTCVQYQQAGLDWCGMTRDLSTRLKSPAFFFQIYDGEVWGYWFFEGGREIGKFVSMPEVYEEATDRPEDWKGNIKAVAARLGIEDADPLTGYLVHLDPEDPISDKVHPGDDCELSDPWVISDFMRKLEILWEDEEGKGSTLYLVKRS